jgi:hypothetical protein
VSILDQRKNGICLLLDISACWDPVAPSKKINPNSKREMYPYPLKRRRLVRLWIDSRSIQTLSWKMGGTTWPDLKRFTRDDLA